MPASRDQSYVPLMVSCCSDLMMSLMQVSRPRMLSRALLPFPTPFVRQSWNHKIHPSQKINRSCKGTHQHNKNLNSFTWIDSKHTFFSLFFTFLSNILCQVIELMETSVKKWLKNQNSRNLQITFKWFFFLFWV